MSAISTIKIEVAYYNSKCALWEPVLEPIVQRSIQDMNPSYKRWDLNVTLHNNASNDFGSALISPSFDEGRVGKSQLRDLFLKVLNSLSTEFFYPSQKEENKKKALTQVHGPVALVVQNRLGKQIELQLKSKGFVYTLVDDNFANDVKMDLMLIWALCPSIKVENGVKFITLGSMVRFKNNYKLPVEIFISSSGKSQTLKKLTVISTDKQFHVPINELNYGKDAYFAFRISEQGGNIGVEFIHWKEIINGSISKVIRCTNCSGAPDVFISFEVSSDSIYFEQSQKLKSVVYNVDIKPVMIFKNCLPLTLHFNIGNNDNKESSFIDPGTIAQFRGMKYGETIVKFQIFEFRNMDWTCNQVISKFMPELSLWKFESMNGDKKQKMDFVCSLDFTRRDTNDISLCTFLDD
ncbi:VPS13A_C [Lepeophtheirus salmonis]|uniref:VPS13A_C n=1 Tax=Lepeophtheirus salmonis TaxID=72036 RepID=A0A7R8CBZ3_LEPSM|nr:VPS13A_C [Lepeophtheirus salmonis]CAF2763085.1 VPS13A_C [Lepeophtheirus salmonis]